MAAGDVTLKQFQVGLPNGQQWTKELYANGRHQCQLNILIVKQVENDDGHWIDTPLTVAERNSATITEFGLSSAVPPTGWWCDSVKNQFDLGLRPLGVEEIKPEVEPVDSNIELIKLYMRADPGGPMNVEKLMAKIVVGGKMFTTNGSFGGAQFNSFVDIQLSRPYQLTIAELFSHVDIHAYSHSHNSVDIDMYYWWPIDQSLHFVENLGLDAPVGVNGEGTHFHTSYVKDIGGGIRYKGGVVMLGGGNLTVDQIHRGNGSNAVHFNKVSTIMRAARYRGWMDTPNSDRQSAWRLLDNFGCVHVFFIGWGDHGNVLLLRT